MVEQPEACTYADMNARYYFGVILFSQRLLQNQQYIGLRVRHFTTTAAECLGYHYKEEAYIKFLSLSFQSLI